MVPQAIATAPGRINLIGDHTDYTGGFAIPAPIDRHVIVAASVAGAGTLTAYSAQNKESWSYAAEEPAPESGWKAFAYGAWRLWGDHFGRENGFDLYISGDVPQGAGLSSSAALEVALLKAMLAASDTELDDLALCKMAQQIEHQFLNVQCGLLDQMAVVFGSRNHLLEIDFQDLSFSRHSIPQLDAQWVVVDSGVRRSLGETGYSERVAEMDRALAELQMPHWRAIGLSDLARLGPVLAGRVRHFVTENERVRAFSAALGAGDLVEAGALLNAGHASLRDDYASSCAACDHLQSHAIAIDGCYGSRIMGGGFGGCTLNLVASDRVGYFKDALLPRYGGDWGKQARAFVFDFADGAALHSS